ncbi:MAG: hypothetical protein HY360_24150 [Verrucomicrobia bacterium]|nr:hypothetical protein [Verrucomicrobiota bacterium]
MVTLTLNDDQIVDAVSRLPAPVKRQLLARLNSERDAWWEQAAIEWEKDLRRLAAERGLNWDSLSENEREKLVGTLMHEDAG